MKRSSLGYWVGAISVLSSVLTVSAPVYAGGGMDGGGGDAVVLADDTVVIGDRYALRSGAASDLPPEVKGELAVAENLLVAYGATPDDAKDQSSLFPRSKFIRSSVLHNRIEYRFVDRLPQIAECADSKRLPKDLPAGARVHSLACTEGAVTWILGSVFRRMSVRDQALTIIHERLHGLSTPDLGDDVKHEMIADLTTGLTTALDLHNAQKNGARGLIASEQNERLSVLVRRILQLGVGEADVLSYYDVASGGGLVERSNDSSAGLIGVGSVVGARCHSDSTTVLLGSMCTTAATLSGATIVDSRLSAGSFTVSPGTRILRSRLSGLFTIGSQAELSDVWLGNSSDWWDGATAISIGDNAALEHTVMSFDGIKSVSFDDRVIVSGVGATLFRGLGGWDGGKFTLRFANGERFAMQGQGFCEKGHSVRVQSDQTWMNSGSIEELCAPSPYGW